jgi:tellurite resistance protein TehA-like permease
VPPGSPFGRRLRATLRGLSPGYFAAVMATGIISTGLQDDGRIVLSRVLLALGVVAFVGLLVLNAWRVAYFRAELVEDFTHPLRGFGFYTFVAAADVLAARIADRRPSEALWLLVVAAVCWLLRGYAVPWTTRLGADEHPIVAAANGSWFMWAVGGQSIAVAAAVLAHSHSGQALPAVAVAAWCLGVFLYAVDGVFVAMRLLAYDFSAEDLTPPYWVAMGAAAITALAGAEITLLPAGPVLDVAREGVRAGSLFAWVLATWLLPALFAMGWWRHITHRVPLRYDANLWSIVFPLGMYAVASTRLGAIDGLDVLTDVGRVWVWIALAAWLLTTAAGTAHVVRRLLLADPRGEA